MLSSGAACLQLVNKRNTKEMRAADSAPAGAEDARYPLGLQCARTCRSPEPPQQHSSSFYRHVFSLARTAAVPAPAPTRGIRQADCRLKPPIETLLEVPTVLKPFIGRGSYLPPLTVLPAVYNGRAPLPGAALPPAAPTPPAACSPTPAPAAAPPLLPSSSWAPRTYASAGRGPAGSTAPRSRRP